MTKRTKESYSEFFKCEHRAREFAAFIGDKLSAFLACKEERPILDGWLFPAYYNGAIDPGSVQKWRGVTPEADELRALLESPENRSLFESAVEAYITRFFEQEMIDAMDRLRVAALIDALVRLQERAGRGSFVGPDYERLLKKADPGRLKTMPRCLITSYYDEKLAECRLLKEEYDGDFGKSRNWRQLLKIEHPNIDDDLLESVRSLAGKPEPAGAPSDMDGTPHAIALEWSARLAGRPRWSVTIRQLWNIVIRERAMIAGTTAPGFLEHPIRAEHFDLHIDEYLSGEIAPELPTGPDDPDDA
jgi:hypothetical protein